MGKYLDLSCKSLKEIMYLIYIILKHKYLNAIIVTTSHITSETKVPNYRSIKWNAKTRKSSIITIYTLHTGIM